MGKRAQRLRILLICGVTILCAEQATRRIFCDFRIDGIQGPVVKDGATLSPRVREQTLSTLFPKYLTAESECGRKSGQMVASIEAFADGSFTTRGRRQRTYFVKAVECFAPRPSYSGTYWLAIFEGPRLLARVYPRISFPGTMSDEATGLVAAADVNHDGVDELFLEAVGAANGDVLANASLVSLRGGELHVLKEFNDAYENSCGAGLPERARVTASVIAYTRTEWFVEQYEAPCKGGAVHGGAPSLADFKRAQRGHE